MRVEELLKSVQKLTQKEANDYLFSICGIKDFFSSGAMRENDDEKINSDTKEAYGDWQTNEDLAHSICAFIKDTGFNPDVVIEPTCGKGAFIKAALDVFDSVSVIYGVEIYNPYLELLKNDLLERSLKFGRSKATIILENANVFDYDFSKISKKHKDQTILVLGNPPWVTNSKLSSINSLNLPTKTNFKQTKGLDAITGKGNFDIAEYISIMLIRTFSSNIGKLAFLVKNIVPKNIVYEQPKAHLCISNICQWNIDATKEFDVSASASLFTCQFGGSYSLNCSVYDFYTKQFIQEYGWINHNFVSNVQKYRQTQKYDGICPYVWWSGVKHDCAKVMELKKNADGNLYNSLGEMVDIESELVFPLLKSSDIGKERITGTSRYVIITQHTASEDTDFIKDKYPKAYAYLNSHAKELDGRKSVIYKKRPRFSIFGIGPYSFAPYKIVVSGLYKHTRFSLVPTIENKPVIVDDTCYLLGFDTEINAKITLKLLNRQDAQDLLHSLIFSDAKRVINKDILMRLNLSALAESCTSEELDTSQVALDEYKMSINANILFQMH